MEVGRFISPWILLLYFALVTYIQVLFASGAICHEISNILGSRHDRSTDNTALNRLSCHFPSNEVISIIGPSKSGKSTLGKILCGQEHQTSGVISYRPSIIDAHGESSIGGVLVDKLFSLTYSETTPIRSLLANSPDYLHFLQSENFPLSASSQELLESQKKIFEIVLKLSQLPTSVKYCIIVIDEYLDDDAKIVRRRVGEFLKRLSSKVTNPLPIEIQAFIITHSQAVMRECSQFSIILNKGKLFDAGNPFKVLTPSQMDWVT